MEIEKYQFLQKLQNLDFVKEIWLFGSRSRQENLERSDIDLAISCPQATQQDWFNLLEIIENADTLLKIDCIRLDTLTKTSKIRENIKKGRKIYEKPQN